MKYIVTLARIIVGALFIVSGLIKLNDPVGFSFKLEEYFSQGVLDLPFFAPYALAIAIFVVVVEVVLGVMLLVGFRKKFTLWSLLLMIVFFTFLTFYSAFYNKVTDCGCFGDAIKLTPWESFIKDVFLLVLILLLWLGNRHIRPLFTNKARHTVVLAVLVVSVFYANHVLNHLPEIDFRPYKIGANIEHGMSVPEDAPKAIFEYAWKFNVGGEEKVIVTNGAYPSVDGEFVDVETTEIQKGYEPPIHDFTIERHGEDFTSSLLREPKLVMVVAYDLRKTNTDAFDEIKLKTDEALRKHYKVIGVSASDSEYSRQLAEHYKLNFEFYFTDETALKTIVRSNPGVLILNEGTIMDKVHFNDLDQLKLENDRIQDLNIELKKSLDSIMVLDQKHRSNYSADTWKFQVEIDSSNIEYVADIIAEHGYPGISLVGEQTSAASWYVIQHSNKIAQYLETIKSTAENEELPYHYYAKMLDRHLKDHNQPQIYGTQGMSYFMGTPNQISFIWPIKNPDSVNILRKRAGFETTVEENSKILFGEDFEFKSLSFSDLEARLNKMK